MAYSESRHISASTKHIGNIPLKDTLQAASSQNIFVFY